MCNIHSHHAPFLVSLAPIIVSQSSHGRCPPGLCQVSFIDKIAVEKLYQGSSWELICIVMLDLLSFTLPFNVGQWEHTQGLVQCLQFESCYSSSESRSCLDFSCLISWELSGTVVHEWAWMVRSVRWAYQVMRGLQNVRYLYMILYLFHLLYRAQIRCDFQNTEPPFKPWATFHNVLDSHNSFGDVSMFIMFEEILQQPFSPVYDEVHLEQRASSGLFWFSWSVIMVLLDSNSDRKLV